MCLLLTGTMLQARSSRGLEQYLGVSVGAGEANQLSLGSSARPSLGAAGNLALHYELHKHQFIFGVGLQGQYQWTQNKMNDFCDEFARQDKYGESLRYGYVYTNYRDAQSNLRISIPVYVGGQFNDYVYALLGAKFSVSALQTHKTTTALYTQGTYAWSIQPTRSVGGNDFTALGFYPEQKYTASGTYTENMWVAAMAEVGSYIPTTSKKMRLRMGVYADYAFRLGSKKNLQLTDYAAVDADPQTQSLENMQQKLVINPMLNSDRLSHLAQNLEVGVRLTLLFHIAQGKAPCHCVQ